MKTVLEHATSRLATRVASCQHDDIQFTACKHRQVLQDEYEVHPMKKRLRLPYR